jgi:murein L,D-transpeptidase YcbB/YkuD
MLLAALLLQVVADTGGGLRTALEAVRGPERITLDSIYRAARWQPLWVRDTAPFPTALGLQGALAAAQDRGLDPADYPASRITWDETGPASRAEADVALTRDALRMARALARGRVAPNAVDTSSVLRGRPFDAVQVLTALASSGDVAASLDLLEPADPEYWRLRRALPALRQVADTATSWDGSALPRVLRHGDSGSAVVHLRRRLAQLGFLPADSAAVDRFDSTVVAAVTAFQRRSGLDADGVVGPASREALAIPMHWRVRQAELTLERWRWFGDPGGGLVIDVDVTAAMVRVREGLTWSTLFLGRAIVGALDSPTPLMESEVRRIIFNPVWVVPNSIAREESLPRFLSDSTAFARGRYQLTRAGAAVPSTAENLADIGRTVTLRQLPGPANSLGRIKLEVAGASAIHLHDTPSRSLFARDIRLLSHGCIRVEQPEVLAHLLLRDVWDSVQVTRAARDTVTRAITLARPVPVRMLYLTAHADSSGAVTFRPDPYGRDVALDRALRTRRR